MDYITAEVEIKGRPYEFTYSIYSHVDGYWIANTNEFVVTEEPEFLFVEAVDNEGALYEPTKEQIDIGRVNVYKNYMSTKGFYV
jgi:hypothetical protein